MAFVQYEHPSVPCRSRLGRCTDDRRVNILLLLTGLQPDVLRTEHERQFRVGFPCEHPKRSGVHAASCRGERRQRIVGFPGVRRPCMNRERLRAWYPRHDPDEQLLAFRHPTKLTSRRGNWMLG